jgi:hypothetical protein
MNTIRVLPAGSAEWPEWLALAPHDFYHSSQYHRFSQEQGEGAAFMVVSGGRDRFVAWPYLLRDVGQSHATDIGSVYGYSGPVCHGCEPGDAFAKQAMIEIEEAWRQQGAVSSFSRLHPLLENHRWIGDQSCLSQHGHTVAIDLTLSPDEVLRRYNRKLRQELRYAREAGVETFIDEEWRYLDDFMALYHHTMQRNGAASGYFFSADYIRQFRKAMAPHAVLMVAVSGQKTIAACIFVEYGDHIQAHLEGADEQYLPVSPFKVMVDDERIRGQSSGRKRLHLGGGRGGAEDALFTVKRRFSPLHFPFFTFRKVLRQPAYNELTEGRRVEAARAGRVFEPNGFFPAYRAPAGDHKVLTGAAS